MVIRVSAIIQTIVRAFPFFETNPRALLSFHRHRFLRSEFLSCIPTSGIITARFKLIQIASNLRRCGAMAQNGNANFDLDYRGDAD